jgi:tetratricopeptide (TPR) repeat protein
MWALQRVIYYEKDDLKKVTSILKKLVTHYPKWMYWKNLGGMYGSQEQDMNQLVSYEIVYLNDELTTESEVMSMAYMYLGADVPYRAANIIDKGMRDNIVDKNAKYLDLLGTAWLQAKHLPEALKAFESASKLADSGEIQYRIASIYLDLGQDKKAYKASVKAANKGGIKNPAANYSKMGSALINLHCYKDAVKAFNKSVKAAKTKREKRFPRQWIKFANYEGDRLQRLRDVGATVPSCSKA